MSVLRLLLTPILLILLCICLFLIYYVPHRMSYWKRYGIPHDKPNLLFGNLQGLRTKFHIKDIQLRYYNKYKGTGPFCGFYHFQTPAAFLLDAQLIHNVLIKDFDKFADRPFYYNEKDDPLSANLITIPCCKWKQLRPKVTPIFSAAKQDLSFPLLMKVSQELVCIVREKLARKCSAIDVKNLFISFTMDVIATVFLGIELNCLRNSNAKLRHVGLRALHGHVFQGTTKWQHFSAAFAVSYPELAQRIHMTVTPADSTAFIKRVVESTVAFRETHNVQRNDLLDALIECKNKPTEASAQPLTLEEVVAQCYVTYLAGYEVASSTGSFVLYELALNQDVQERLRTEIKEALERHNQEFTAECIKELQYLDQVILETLRLNTIIPNILRRALVDYVVPDAPGYVIEKGTMIIIPTAAINRDPVFFNNPDIFNPDNFSPENVRARNTVASMAFGEGPRNCIGMAFAQMELRLVLAMLVKNFKFSQAFETKVPYQVDKTEDLLDSVGGIYLKVEKI